MPERGRADLKNQIRCTYVLCLAELRIVFWQVIGVSTADPKAKDINSVADLEKAFPGQIDAVSPVSWSLWFGVWGRDLGLRIFILVLYILPFLFFSFLPRFLGDLMFWALHSRATTSHSLVAISSSDPRVVPQLQVRRQVRGRQVGRHHRGPGEEPSKPEIPAPHKALEVGKWVEMTEH